MRRFLVFCFVIPLVNAAPRDRWTAHRTVDRMFHGVFQMLVPIVAGTAQAGGGSFTSVQRVSGRRVSGNPVSCTGNTCTLTVAATGGTGNFGMLSAFDWTYTTTLTGVTGGCNGSWTIRSGASVASTPNGWAGGYTCNSMPAANTTTTLTLTWSATVTSDDVEVNFQELNWSGTSVAFDTANGGTVASCGGGPCYPAGATLTLTGTNDVIMQNIFAGGSSSHATAAASPYNTNYTLFQGASSLGATSYILNTSSGAAPTWTQTTGSLVIVNGLAMKGQ